MAMVGLIGLLVAFAGVGVSVLGLAVGHAIGGTARKQGADGAVAEGVSETLTWGGRVVCGAHGVLRHSGVLLHDGRHFH